MAETQEDVFKSVLAKLALSTDDWKTYLTSFRQAGEVAVPRNVEYAMEWFQQNDDDLGEVMRNAYEDMVDDWKDCPQLREVEMWIIDHSNEFAEAWIHGTRTAEDGSC